MKKKNVILLNIISVVGAAFLCVGCLTDIDYYSGFFFALGFALLINSLIQLIRILYWQSPKRKAEYEAKAHEAHINQVDERKQFLRSKAGHIAYQIMHVILMELAVVLALLRVDPWVVSMIFLLYIFQWIIGIVIYRFLQKRM